MSFQLLFGTFLLLSFVLGCQPEVFEELDGTVVSPTQRTSVDPDPVAAESTVQPDDFWGTPETETAPEIVRMLAWNIESGGANPDTIARQLAELPRYDIYALTEVRPLGFPAIKEALGADYDYLYSRSGNDDRLAFAIRRDRFEFLDHYEFDAYGDYVINPGNYRSPFVFELKDRRSGQTFLVMLNHLARGRAEVRQQQAEGIREWARGQGNSIIALGDYNFDYVFATDKGNPAMDIFLKDDVFRWVRPVPMIDSNYYDGDGDGIDDYIDSLLDFAFVAGNAKDWKAACRIIVRPSDFPDDQETSDHRPVEFLIHPEPLEAQSGKGR